MSKPPLRESHTIDGSAGSLELMLESPATYAGGGTAVICHPHPLHGGSMDNKVVHTLGRAANDLGLRALKFNFRGVGASGGSYDSGRGEQEDTLAVIRWAGDRFDDLRLLAGFSFGAIVAIEVARRHPPPQLVSIAPPVERIDTDWAQPRCPWLIVQGESDELVSTEALVEWFNALEPGPELVLMPGTSHFFHGQLAALRQTLVNNLSPC